VPCDPNLEEYVNAWIAAARIGRNKKGPLFSSVGKGDRLGKKAMSRFDSRLISKTAVPSSARTLANHGSPRTTKLYDRTREELSADEIGRIRI